MRILFAGILGVGRAFELEQSDQALVGLSPTIGKSVIIFAAKAIVSFVLRMAMAGQAPSVIFIHSTRVLAWPMAVLCYRSHAQPVGALRNRNARLRSIGRPLGNHLSFGRCGLVT